MFLDLKLVSTTSSVAKKLPKGILEGGRGEGFMCVCVVFVVCHSETLTDQCYCSPWKSSIHC